MRDYYTQELGDFGVFCAEKRLHNLWTRGNSVIMNLDWLDRSDSDWLDLLDKSDLDLVRLVRLGLYRTIRQETCDIESSS